MCAACFDRDIFIQCSATFKLCGQWPHGFFPYKWKFMQMQESNAKFTNHVFEPLGL